MTPIAIVSKPQKEELVRLMPQLVAWLRDRGIAPILDPASAGYLPGEPFVPRSELPAARPELVIVLGGDGTLLAVGRAFARTGTPLLSVNLGSLGFLTEVRLANLFVTLEGWYANLCTIDERAMLHAGLWRGGELHASFEALNDIVLAKSAIARMGEYAIELEGKLAARFRADGVIVSTPTGSTAYTLAANGPILVPDVDALVVTPICPHLLTLRPIVVRGDAALTIRIEGIPNQNLLTVDGQEAIELKLGDEVRCHRSEHKVRLVRLGENGFFDALRSKLKWGER